MPPVIARRNPAVRDRAVSQAFGACPTRAIVAAAAISAGASQRPLGPVSHWTSRPRHRYRRAMAVIATIMNTATGQPIQKMTFGRMPKPWASFNLATGELVTADRVDVGKPAPGKFVAPVSVWVTPKK
jgi:hypothetical protein